MHRLQWGDDGPARGALHVPAGLFYLAVGLSRPAAVADDDWVGSRWRSAVPCVAVVAIAQRAPAPARKWAAA